ncbi:enoyl-CoA hydratase-related protein [Rhodococcus opacus]|uniref:enoyl-CoA hydratase-related protein n=1 Tax=Rhodococcus opacus TaxID=37919 RepID=UPI00146D2EC5
MRLVELPRPVVAAVDGLGVGVGVSLALACDLLLVSARTQFRLGFSGVGLMPDGGASAFAGRQPRPCSRSAHGACWTRSSMPRHWSSLG